MKQPTAILIGLSLIAAAILVANRWEISVDSQAPAMLVRLDRWTGTSKVCILDTEAKVLEGSEYRCFRK